MPMVQRGPGALRCTWTPAVAAAREGCIVSQPDPRPPAELTVPPAAPPAQYPAGPPVAWSTPSGPGPSGVLTDQRQVSGAVVALAWVSAVLTLGYMLPWAIAATRGKANQAAIGVINLLLGWSFVGWVVALVMACLSHHPLALQQVNLVVAPQVVAPQPVGVPAGWYPSPGGAGHEYWDGARWTGHRAP